MRRWGNRLGKSDHFCTPWEGSSRFILLTSFSEIHKLSWFATGIPTNSWGISACSTTSAICQPPIKEKFFKWINPVGDNAGVSAFAVTEPRNYDGICSSSLWISARLCGIRRSRCTIPSCLPAEYRSGSRSSTCSSLSWCRCSRPPEKKRFVFGQLSSSSSSSS